MVASKKDQKPIAVLCRNAPDGLQFMLKTLGDNVVEYSFPRGWIVAQGGQEYFIVTNENQLMGLEISDFRIVPGFGWRNPEAENIIRRANERIRK